MYWVFVLQTRVRSLQRWTSVVPNSLSKVSEVTLRKHRVELEEELVDLGQALPWGARLRDVFDFNFINFIPARVPFLLEHRAALRALAEANPAQKTKRAPGTNAYKLAPEKKMPQALTRDKV